MGGTEIKKVPCTFGNWAAKSKILDHSYELFCLFLLFWLFSMKIKSFLKQVAAIKVYLYNAISPNAHSVHC